ncbi:MAG: DUF4254 domain-containing protein [Saprospiraceae bacterium]|nr:DUF4254 domain-containing protein [Saprospiraceae bacterium]
MISAEYCTSLFYSTIEEYHKTDNINQPCPVPDSNSLENILIKKCWIDIVQWHLEDIIRRPDLDPLQFIEIKRKIDSSNQERTDCVESIDEYLLEEFNSVKIQDEPRLNTETPAWVIDRLSILMLKIFHMKEQTEREDASEEHLLQCSRKLKILMQQKLDLSFSFNNFLKELSEGKAVMKTYRQMKMYNDPSTNPELYKLK